jgi:DNA-binding winged helix-turn-helix (wHTH) protein
MNGHAIGSGGGARSMMEAGAPDQIRFGQFVLDLGTRELRDGSEPLHLTPKAFELLLVLIEQRPRAVAKAALQERLWPSTFVSEANLPILVGEVRAALRDDARKPEFVRTVHGFGYAFCGEAAGSVPGSSKPAATTSSCWLISKTRHVALHEGDNIIGRDPSGDVWLDGRGVSRRHAKITVQGGTTATLADLESKNGTWVNGHRLLSVERLADGAQIKLGSVRITFRVWTDGGSTETTGLTS